MTRIVPDKTSDVSVEARIAMFRAPPAGARMTRHSYVFRRTVQPYRRGGNENRNGVIRRHLPERFRIEPSMANDVQAIMDGINNRPMRVLGHRAPAKAFTDELIELTNEQGRCTSE